MLSIFFEINSECLKKFDVGLTLRQTQFMSMCIVATVKDRQRLMEETLNRWHQLLEGLTLCCLEKAWLKLFPFGNRIRHKFAWCISNVMWHFGILLQEGLRIVENYDQAFQDPNNIKADRFIQVASDSANSRMSCEEIVRNHDLSSGAHLLRVKCKLSESFLKQYFLYLPFRISKLRSPFFLQKCIHMKLNEHLL